MARVEIPIVILDGEEPSSPVSGASVVVIDRATEEEAVVYSASIGETEASQPLSSDSKGRVNGWLERGSYELSITVGEKTPYIEYLEIAPGTDESVDTAWIASSAVTAVKIATDAIETTKIEDAAVTPAKLASNAVEEVKIKDGAVTPGKLATGAVETSKLASESVETAKIKDEAVTDAKLNSPHSEVLRSIYRTTAIANNNFGEVNEGNLLLMLPTNNAEGKLATGGMARANIEVTTLQDSFPFMNYIASDFAVNGLTHKLRLRIAVMVNASSSSPIATIGLYPITQIGGESLSTLRINTGTIVTGSSLELKSPETKKVTILETSDFAAPSDGPYVVCIKYSIGPGANSNHHYVAEVLGHYV